MGVVGSSRRNHEIKKPVYYPHPHLPFLVTFPTGGLLDMRPKRLSPSQKKELIRLYNKGWSTYTLAGKYNRTPQTVGRWLRNAGAVMRTATDGMRLALKILSEKDERWIVRMYQGDNWSMEKLAAKFRVHPGTIRNVLIREKVEIKPRGGSRKGARTGKS